MSFAVLVLGCFSLGSFVQFNSTDNNEEDVLKVMSYNVEKFNDDNGNGRSIQGKGIIEFIKKEDPDILCIQEYSRIWNERLKHFKYFSQTPYSSGKTNQAIYSKYPIVEEGSLKFPNSLNNSIYVDIRYKKDTLRVYNLHLESLKVRPRSLKRERSDRLLGRLRYSFAKQQEQADLIRAHMNQVDYKKIVCADMNNTQYSYAYQELKQDMEDSFLEKGNGYGTTIKFWKFPLRIDFILADPGIDILSHKNYKVSLSDHEPIMATLKVGPHE
ncbi:endonuclease/exonuclease/phosphatase family protein [Maribacter litopenaei]|uniref:Endonuclease/exonuclease/phosphatase family protein n=1 Tax=Maribacter litopenaei TaxID=2976127 RepID=A0ABY5YAT0_9FLAO|nr:endonuclease/exonuclease/phosphatase family protein [Maribacter litopenaei]UWX56014.1 endonuclease/exonuclease/phosphatase family protein [Maribacter litopenaei]